MGLVENIEVFDELLRNGVPTKKFVNYKNWDEVLKLLAKSSTDRYAQLPSGQVVKILDKVALSPGSTATANYALANVSVAETEILYGDAVIDMVTGETIALGESTTGIVVSGTTDAAAAGSMGTVTACESGFLITPAFVVVAAVAALCGFAIGDAIGAKIVAEMNDEEFDWGEDSYTGRFITGLVGDIKDGVLVRYKLGGKTFFDEDLVNRIYNKLVQKGFFFEGDYPFTPETIEPGKTYNFNNLVSLKELAKEQVKLIKKAVDIDSYLQEKKETDYPNILLTEGYNDALFNLLDNFVNNYDETGLNGIGSITFNIRLGLSSSLSSLFPSVYVSAIFRRTDKNVGRYEELENSDSEFKNHPIKRIYFDGTQTIKRNSRSITHRDGYFEGYGWITTSYRSPNYYIDTNNVKIYNTSGTETETNNYITGSYYDISRPFTVDEGLWRYLYASESWNIGRFSVLYPKRKLPNAIIPDPSKSLRDNYKDWANKREEISTPTNDNKNKKRPYVPIGINNFNRHPKNDKRNNQKDIQDGKNDEEDIDTTIGSQKIIINNIIELPTDPDDPPNEDIGKDEDTPIVVNPVSDTGFVSVYAPTSAQLRAFSQFLWSKDFVDIVNKFFSDPMNAIIGLHMIYCEPSLGSNQSIIAGFVDSHVISRTVSNQYVTIDCGSVTVKEYYEDARDYDFTNISVFLPFIGIHELKAKDIIGKTVKIIANVDVLTGTLLYKIQVNNRTLYTFSGNCAVQLPISGASYNSILTSTLSLAAGVVGTVASGGALAPVLAGGAIGAIAGSQTSVQVSNNIGSNAGAMGNKKPYLIINRKNSYNANKYYTIQGYPANEYVLLSNCKGFTKIKEIHLENIPATNEEIDEINTLLKEGVIL